MGGKNGSNALSIYDDQLYYGIQWSGFGTWQDAQPHFEKDIQIQQFWSVCNLYGVFLRFSYGCQGSE